MTDFAAKVAAMNPDTTLADRLLADFAVTDPATGAPLGPSGNAAQLSHCAGETRVLAILEDLQRALVRSLDSLAGKSSTGIEAVYLVEAAKAINKASDGYLCLRQSIRVAASKLLVRPIIEFLLNAGAAAKDKAFFYRKAYSEWRS
jgi:hypothetical protein